MKQVRILIIVCVALVSQMVPNAQNTKPATKAKSTATKTVANAVKRITIIFLLK